MLYIYIYMLVGEITPNGFSGCSVTAFPEVVFKPHYIEIVAGVKALRQSHVCVRTVTGSEQ